MAFASFLQRLLRVNAAVPYSLTLPAADAYGALFSDGAGVVSFETSPLARVCEGRLTLESGVPVSTTDQSAKATAYWTPYDGNRIALYNGTLWRTRTFAEIAISLVGKTASTPYDVFAYDNASTVTLELVAWSSATAIFGAGTYQTTRPTQDGIYVKSTDGTAIDATRRYVGSIYINATGGQTDDAEGKRYVSNMYNRRPRSVRKFESTATWAYTTASFQQANAAAANKIEVMVGMPEQAILLLLSAAAQNNTGGVQVKVGIGADSTTVVSANAQRGILILSGDASEESLSASLIMMPAVGYHYFSWLEYSEAAGATTWYGSSLYGLSGTWWC